ncbi:sestrin-2-like [Protopterus annectens]|uniref:sestrin-2-like n=1 Tax=Protopterus annectens TaxID=7888 RepID=UPI001CF98710|nr:sestrin-2-like [Protopterus annectens]
MLPVKDTNSKILDPGSSGMMDFSPLDTQRWVGLRTRMEEDRAKNMEQLELDVLACTALRGPLGTTANMEQSVSSRRENGQGKNMEQIDHSIPGSVGKSGPVVATANMEHTSESQSLLLLLLRMSKSCPYKDVRKKSSEILQAAQDRRVKIPRPLGHGPSSFIPLEEIQQEGVDGSEQHIFMEAFIAAGRVDNVMTVMGLHPKYLSCFWATHHYLLRMDSPLPFPVRHYIAIMAAARHQCSQLVNLHISEYIHVGGDPLWLNGIKFAPEKLRNLNEINKILAHRPWLITKEHIEALLKTGENSWSLAELIQAVILLVHFHSLSSFVFGCGVNPELDLEGGHVFRPPSPRDCYLVGSSPGSKDCVNGIRQGEAVQEVEALMAKMKLLQQTIEEEASQEEMYTRFEKAKTESLFVTPSDKSEALHLASVSCFVEDSDFQYKDFSRRGEVTPPTFRAQDFTWEDHGYSLTTRLYPDAALLLDKKFLTAYSLTYNTMAMHCDVDTSMLRRAIWNYIHCVFGIRYDDYDYGQVNVLLERSLKVYIKTVACYPERTTKKMYLDFWKHFRNSEKVHVNLILLEARMQAALLYALRAITRYMT